MNQDELGLTGNHYVDQITKGQDEKWEVEALYFLLNDKPSKVVKHENAITRFYRISI